MNIAAALKNEITRVARKEIKTETLQLKKSSARQRSDISSLKKRITDLERSLSKFSRTSSVQSDSPPQEEKRPLRMTFSPTGLAAQRKRLGLSAQDLGVLVGASAQSVYKWEQGKAKPRATQLVALRGIRSLGKREAAEKLADLPAGG
jgi:DNA-binding transcriptional regulator YiaG